MAPGVSHTKILPFIVLAWNSYSIVNRSRRFRIRHPLFTAIFPSPSKWPPKNLGMAPKIWVNTNFFSTSPGASENYLFLAYRGRGFRICHQFFPPTPPCPPKNDPSLKIGDVDHIFFELDLGVRKWPIFSKSGSGIPNLPSVFFLRSLLPPKMAPQNLGALG